MKNAQLWKRILHSGIHTGSPAKKAFESFLIQQPIIVDARVADETFVDEKLLERMNGGGVLLSGYSALANPFPVTWIESAIGHQERKILFGCLVDARSSRWVLYTLATAHDGTVVNCGNVCFEVDENRTPSSKVEFEINPDTIKREGEQRSVGYAMRFACGILDTLQLLGCTNVSLAERDNDARDARIATKRHGPSSTGYRYHVLTVRPAGSKPGTPGVEIGTMPRHVCRGHFQHYGPADAHGHPDGQERGLLFGKYAGRFFMPPHVRGKAENGIVEKDYEVRA